MEESSMRRSISASTGWSPGKQVMPAPGIQIEVSFPSLLTEAEHIQ
jgi:hypothetical protein